MILCSHFSPFHEDCLATADKKGTPRVVYDLLLLLFSEQNKQQFSLRYHRNSFRFFKKKMKNFVNVSVEFCTNLINYPGLVNSSNTSSLNLLDGKFRACSQFLRSQLKSNYAVTSWTWKTNYLSSSDANKFPKKRTIEVNDEDYIVQLRAPFERFFECLTWNLLWLDSPTTFNRYAWLIFGSVETWHCGREEGEEGLNFVLLGDISVSKCVADDSEWVDYAAY
jgi:hypothetical protein